jgi:hypothetical protein
MSTKETKKDDHQADAGRDRLSLNLLQISCRIP